MRLNELEVLRATRTPEGPATIHLRLDRSAGAVHAQAWGRGALWALETLPDQVGANDDDAPLTLMIGRPYSASQRLIWDLRRRLPGLRIPRTCAVTEALVPIILEQKVTGIEAHSSYRRLVEALGEPAPGPSDVAGGLKVPPSSAVLASTPYWCFHPFGIERKRAETIRLACSHASRLDNLVHLQPADARGCMTSLTGVGSWSAAEVSLVALGDPDAVSIGDYHLPHQVGWALAGIRRSDDSTMLQLLEPYRGQRGRVVRLIEAAGISPPRRGPRQPLRTFSLLDR